MGSGIHYQCFSPLHSGRPQVRVVQHSGCLLGTAQCATGRTLQGGLKYHTWKYICFLLLLLLLFPARYVLACFAKVGVMQGQEEHLLCLFQNIQEKVNGEMDTCTNKGLSYLPTRETSCQGRLPCLSIGGSVHPMLLALCTSLVWHKYELEKPFFTRCLKDIGSSLHHCHLSTPYSSTPL